MTLFINGKTYEAGELIGYVKNLEKENAELKADNEARKFAMAMSAKVEKQLREENAELKKLFADCDTCKRTCDIGSCCKFGSDYLPDVEKVLNKQKRLEALEGQTPCKEIKEKGCESCTKFDEVQLTKAKELIKTLLLIVDNKVSQMEFQLCIADAKQFINER